MIFAQISQLAFPSVSWFAIAPELALAVGAAVVLLVDVQWKPKTRVLGYLAALAITVAAAFSLAQWLRLDDIFSLPRDQFFRAFLPFGQMVVLDHSSVLARFVLLAVTSLGIASGWNLFEKLGRRAAEALALVLLATTGFALMASSVHLVMIFLGLEVGSISLYVLAGITRERIDSDEAAIKYFLLGSVASAVFIYGAALVFAATGLLNVLQIQGLFTQVVFTKPAILLIGVALLIVGLAFKVSAAPFHSWAPDVYQGAPAGLVGYMAAVAKIGGFAAMMRILFSAVPQLTDDWAPIVAGLAALSMVLGSVVAIVQDDVRRLLAYSGVAHAGFILTGVAAGSAAAPAIWFYVGVYTVQLVGAFAVVAAVGGADASRSALPAYAGLSKRQPFLAASFTVLLLGMAGLPLTSGFVAKFGVFQDAWQGGLEWLVIVALLASVVAFFLYLRVIVVMYMQEPEDAEMAAPAGNTRTVLWIATAVTVVLGLIPAPLLQIAADALPL